MTAGERRHGSGLRAEFSALVRERLLDAASELFSRKGYKAATVRDIAARAKVTHTTFYNHFGSKEAVLYAILEKIGPDVVDRFSAVGGLIGNRTTFDIWFDEYAAFWMANSGIYYAFWEAMTADERIALRTHRQLRSLAEPIAKSLHSDETDRTAATESLALWFMMLDSAMLIVHSDRRKANPALLDAARTQLWCGLGPIAKPD